MWKFIEHDRTHRISENPSSMKKSIEHEEIHQISENPSSMKKSIEHEENPPIMRKFIEHEGIYRISENPSNIKDSTDSSHAKECNSKLPCSVIISKLIHIHICGYLSFEIVDYHRASVFRIEIITKSTSSSKTIHFL